ncbi:hypothetical protein QF117_09160 [Vibrio sp. YMD68]|uniref:hypothetical protein n=1 Tax=Vibrio sp. YMD68 TaxID=3042300 RepID=UPI00249AEF22|nr:hypothetical protein [Vibrio sp. YMD68]WGW00349.1 hypothetical protein QF117_21215 [Vibrio sp. YMD68]WGW00970.1 hypothetical protein QF117_09160 [Vibrio sp. YMD68]
MGSKSKSSSSTTNNYTTNTENYALQGDNEGNAILGSGNTMISTDHGAIGSAFDFAEVGLKEAFGFGESSLKFAGNAFDGALDAVTGTTRDAMDMMSGLTASQSAQNDKSISAIRDLAENVQTGGEAVIAKTSKDMMKMVMAVIGVGLVVTGAVLWSKK